MHLYPVAEVFDLAASERRHLLGDQEWFVTVGSALHGCAFGLGQAEINGQRIFHAHLLSALLAGRPCSGGRGGDHAAGLVGKQFVGRLQYQDVACRTLLFDGERHDHAALNVPFHGLGGVLEVLLHPRAEVVEVAAAERRHLFDDQKRHVFRGRGGDFDRSGFLVENGFVSRRFGCAFGGDHDHAVFTPRTVHCGGGLIFEDADPFDRIGGDVVDARPLDAVDDIERFGFPLLFGSCGALRRGRFLVAGGYADGVELVALGLQGDFKTLCAGFVGDADFPGLAADVGDDKFIAGSR